MKNYISICGKEIELTEEQVAQLREGLGMDRVKLSDVPVADTFKIGDHEFVVLEHSGNTTAVILKGPLFDKMQFGESNNYNGSRVDHVCIQFAAEIAGIVGEENLVEHTVDLTSDDGLKDYGAVKRKASLLTAPKYRRYVEILDEHKVDKWWWLATAYSTPSHDDALWVKCVAPAGFIFSVSYNYDGGVRPFCILKSDIFVSK